MAGEWLKFDSTLPEKQETLAITVAMGWDDADLTVGKLMRLFRWFDQHTVDGNAASVTPALLDRIVGVSGFVSAVAAQKWLIVTDAGICLHHFEYHNGASAKSRALTAKRVATHKSNAKANAEGNADSVSDALPREEKSREEKNKKPPSEVRRATRKCPADFQVTEDLIAWAAGECPTVDLTKSTAKFRDHTYKAAQVDWPATWRNWIRKDAEFSGGGSGKQSEPAWRTEQRERTQKAAPGVAAGGATQFFTDVEAKHVPPIALG